MFRLTGLKKVLAFGLFGAAGCFVGWAIGELVLLAAQVGGPSAKAPSLVSGAVAPPSAAPEPPAEFKERLTAAGAKTGDVQISLLWYNKNDLDLHCIDPSGYEIFFPEERRRSFTGGLLDVDRNAGGCATATASPVENIFWPPGGAPTGRYQVFVEYYGRCEEAPNESAYKVSVLHAGKRDEFTGSMTKTGIPSNDRRLIFEFELGSSLDLYTAKDAPASQGSTMKLPVAVRRSYYNGPVAVRLENPPTGITAEPITIPESETTGNLEVKIAASADPGTVPLKLAAVGESGAARNVSAKAEVSLTISSVGFLSYAWRIVEIGLWTAVVAGGLALALVVGQNYTLARPLFGGGRQLMIVLGSAAVGFVAGSVAQCLFFLMMLASAGGLGFFIGWLLLGGLLGWGMSLFIPNLDVKKSAIAGLVGGGLGALAFLTGATLHELVGRLAGAVVLGFCVGLMVAVVEAAFRQAWLEVRFGPREVVTVNLGPEPVRVGGDARRCAVWAKGAAPVAARYWLLNGQVMSGEGEAGAGTPVRAGEKRVLGSVEVVVQAGNSLAVTSAPRPAPSVAAPAAPPVKPAARSDPFDDMPIAASNPKPAPAPVPRAPAAPSPPAASLPRSTAPPPTGTSPPPPVKPAAPAAPARPKFDDDFLPQSTAAPAAPEGCPSCKRKIAGRAGARYCVVCDKTF